MSETSPNDIETNEVATADARTHRLVATYFRHIVRMKLWSLWWMVVLSLIVIIVGFVIDFRISLAGLMLLPSFYPLSVFMAVMSTAMRTEIIDLIQMTSAAVKADRLCLYNKEGKEILVVPFNKIRSVTEDSEFFRVIDRRYRLYLIPSEMLDAPGRILLHGAHPHEL